MPLKRNARMLLSVRRAVPCVFRSSRRFLSCQPWPGGVGDHQPAAVQHADELLQLFDADRLRRELALEPLGDFVEARLAVEHLQDGVLFFLEAEVLQADGLLHDPVDAALVALLPRARSGRMRIGSFARRAGDKAVGKRGHGEVEGLGKVEGLGVRERQGDMYERSRPVARRDCPST